MYYETENWNKINIIRELKQDQKSNRYDSILKWLQTENGLMILTLSNSM